MKGLVRVGVLAIAVGAATVGLGWWAVPLVGALWGVVAARETWPVTTIAAAAGLSWVVLLGWAAVQGPVLGVANTLGATVSLPGWGVLLLAVVFPTVLAGSAAGVAGTIKKRKKA